VTAQNRRNYTVLSSYDYQSNDITYWIGPFSSCGVQCDATPGCIAYALHKDNGANCWLKHNLLGGNTATNRDTYYVINQAAFRVRLAAKDEVLLTLSGFNYS
jgi:hypothetical protein